MFVVVRLVTDSAGNRKNLTMSARPALPLVVLLLSFPQMVETTYSPALPWIAEAYRVSPEQASQTLSLWFTAFAFGVVAWGRLCDLWGRRPALITGLGLYALGTAWAMAAPDFTQLLLARLLAAFGAAAGAIVTQTTLRDSYRGAALAQVFSVLGLALAVSPAIGMLAGAELSRLAGHQGVFAFLCLLALVLVAASLRGYPETRPDIASPAPLAATLRAMLADGGVWRSAITIAAFNLAIFGYYQLGPFAFERLDGPWLDFGHSGFLLAAASLVAAWLNHALLRRGWPPERLVGLGVFLLAMGAGLVVMTLRSPAFLIGMAIIAAAYALAIPNILAKALHAYADRLGTAGAILSLIYYNLLGAGLALAGLGQRLDLTLAACAAFATAGSVGGRLMRRRPC